LRCRGGGRDGLQDSLYGVEEVAWEILEESH
jgi:hypothetical protein